MDQSGLFQGSIGAFFQGTIGALFHRRERVNETEDGNHTKLGYPPVKKNNLVSKHLRVHAEVF